MCCLRAFLKSIGLGGLIFVLNLYPSGVAKTMQHKWNEYKKESKDLLKTKLSPLSFKVTQEEGTEPAFKNEFWDNKEEGIYVDVVSGEPLFSSTTKFDSGTGWPSFYQPIDKEFIVTRTDRHLFFQTRTEVRSKYGDSHLGHVFEDGPKPTGLRYCMNSAAMRFVPKSKMQELGYGDYLKLFNEDSSSSSKTKHESKKSEEAILAGGCFWGMEDILRKIPGVLDTEVGYTGGNSLSPTYKDVKTGSTGHAEAIKIVYDPTLVGYDDILDMFFKMHDPTTKNRQGNDIGTQYRSAIFYKDEAQKEKALASIQKASNSGMWKEPIVTEVVQAGIFYRAEDYHQDYLEKNPGGYSCHYIRR